MPGKSKKRKWDFAEFEGDWAQLNDSSSLDEFLRLAKSEGWTKLSFSALGLEELPEALADLPHLLGLGLEGNKLRSLPAWLGNLTGLQWLYLTGNRLTELPAWLGNLTGLQSLGLSGNQLKELPAWLGNLTGLERLWLNRNQLTELPAWLGHLTGLERLYLSGNRLTELPAWLGKLTGLQWLDLSGNQLTELPAWLGKLTGLRDLDLSRTQLTELPAELGNLTGLQRLKLSENHLTELPAELGNLTGLQSLGLSGNQLTELPAELGNLTGLQSLYLSDNRLRELPAWLGNLTGLQSLGLSGNQLRELPAWLGNLTGLEWLALSYNQLTELPAELGKLTGLQQLSLYGNQLTELPAELGNLTGLQQLNLSGNQLRELPAWLGNLTGLEWLALSGNKLDLPPEIVESRDAKRILSFYFARDKRPLNEAKLILVGQGGVGKTSLVKRLATPAAEYAFDPREEKTEGVNICHYYVDVGGDKVRLNAWDFGGQEIMHATHQFFLTKRSLYLLVWDARQEDKYGQIEYWLELIRSFGGDSPVLVVMNKCDTGRSDINPADFVRKYKPNLPDKTHFFNVSCLTGVGFEELEAKIASVLGEMDHVRDKWPGGWFEVKKELEQSQQNKPYMNFGEFVGLCEKHTVTEPADRESLIRFLHDLGTVLCFRDDPDLTHNMVLNPRWVTEGVYAVINSGLVQMHKGQFAGDELQDILDSTKYPFGDQTFILFMMRKFELCFELGKGRYLIPELLPAMEPEKLPFDDSDPAPPTYSYLYNVLPGSVITRFIVRLHPYIHDKDYWKTGAVLYFKDLNVKALVRADLTGKRMNIYLDDMGHESANKQVALLVIMQQLHVIHKSIGSLKPAGKIPLPDDSDVLFDHRHLRLLCDKDITSYIPEGYAEEIDPSRLLHDVEINSELELRQAEQLIAGIQANIEKQRGKDASAMRPAGPGQRQARGSREGLRLSGEADVTFFEAGHDFEYTIQGSSGGSIVLPYVPRYLRIPARPKD